VSLNICVSLSLCMSLSVCVCFSVSLCAWLPLSVCVSFSVCVCVSVCVCLCVFPQCLCSCVSHYVSPSNVCVGLSVCVYFSVSVSGVFFQWLSLSYWGQGVVPSFWSRSPECQARSGCVPSSMYVPLSQHCNPCHRGTRGAFSS